jgi:hypothetical protein
MKNAVFLVRTYSKEWDPVFVTGTDYAFLGGSIHVQFMAVKENSVERIVYGVISWDGVTPVEIVHTAQWDAGL